MTLLVKNLKYMKCETLAASPVVFYIPAALPRTNCPIPSTTALLLLLASAVFRVRDWKSKCSWLKDLVDLSWSRPSSVIESIMALKRGLTRKAFVAAMLASDHTAWKLNRLDTMCSLLVASEITESLKFALTFRLEIHVGS